MSERLYHSESNVRRRVFNVGLFGGEYRRRWAIEARPRITVDLRESRRWPRREDADVRLQGGRIHGADRLFGGSQIAIALELEDIDVNCCDPDSALQRGVDLAC